MKIYESDNFWKGELKKDDWQTENFGSEIF